MTYTQVLGNIVFYINETFLEQLWLSRSYLVPDSLDYCLSLDDLYLATASSGELPGHNPTIKLIFILSDD